MQEIIDETNERLSAIMLHNACVEIEGCPFRSDMFHNICSLCAGIFTTEVLINGKIS